MAAAACLPHTHAPIEIKVTSDTPREKPPGVLAYAEISADSAGRIFLLAGRVKSAVGAWADPSTLLAHVLVHEITHVLQGVSRHSETGVMKALWTADDCMAMGSKRLEFAPVDVSLIRDRFAQGCGEVQIAAR